jgi:hypothetical protein
MEIKNMSGKLVTVMPDRKTLDILEDRRKKIRKILEKDMETNSSSMNSPTVKELRALEKTTSFVEWILNNSSKNMVKAIIEKYKYEINKNDNEKIIDENKEEIENTAIEYGYFSIRKNKNHKLRIKLTKYNEKKFI